MINRKDFLKGAGTILTGSVLFPMQAFASFPTAVDETPALEAELVREFVGSCHRDLVKVQELYAQEPKLIYASHDWGGGDFESGIEAAGHVGRKDIAEFLIQKGARTNFFTWCMLGKLDIVLPLLKAFPELIHARGAHGFTALHHAIRGGQEALAVKELLVSLGAVETKLAL